MHLSAHEEEIVLGVFIYRLKVLVISIFVQLNLSYLKSVVNLCLETIFVSFRGRLVDIVETILDPF